MMSILQESFAGIRVIKAFAREKREAENFQSISNEQFKSGVRVRKAIEIVSPMVEAVSAAGEAIAAFSSLATPPNGATIPAAPGGGFFRFITPKKMARTNLGYAQCSPI